VNGSQKLVCARLVKEWSIRLPTSATKAAHLRSHRNGGFRTQKLSLTHISTHILKCIYDYSQGNNRRDARVRCGNSPHVFGKQGEQSLVGSATTKPIVFQRVNMSGS
jgi:hypothetical protein